MEPAATSHEELIAEIKNLNVFGFFNTARVFFAVALVMEWRSVNHDMYSMGDIAATVATIILFTFCDSLGQKKDAGTVEIMLVCCVVLPVDVYMTMYFAKKIIYYK